MGEETVHDPINDKIEYNITEVALHCSNFVSFSDAGDDILHLCEPHIPMD